MNSNEAFFVGTCCLVAVAATSPVAVSAASAAEVQSERVAVWRMNESPNAHVALDSSGSGLNARVGANVETGVTLKKGTGYRFRIPASSYVANNDQLVTYEDDSRLDPGSDPFVVALRVKTRAASGNIVQKGQAGMTGGYWKVEMHSGVLTCIFRSGDGRQSGVGTGKRVDDGKWHRIRCARTTTATSLRLDGVDVDTRNKPTGSVANGSPFSIGGKVFCASAGVGCDYFVGKLDYVRIRAG